MSSAMQDAVCTFARKILAARTGEAITVTARPDIINRRTRAVEELWESASRRYAIEHTRLESYTGQLGNAAKIERLIGPVRDFLRGRLPGSHVLAVRCSETQVAEIIKLVLQAAPALSDGETITLPSSKLPFAVQLHRRGGAGSHVAVHCLIEGDAEDLRLHRMRRALSDKCPKLAAAAVDGFASVLVLEANDIQLSNAFVAFDAFKKAISGRSDQPYIVIFVETDASPFGWVLKEGDRFGDDIPMPNGRHCYTEGEIS